MTRARVTSFRRRAMTTVLLVLGLASLAYLAKYLRGTRARRDACTFLLPQIEASINGDAIPDLIGLCVGSSGPRFVAIDGATFATLWWTEPQEQSPERPALTAAHLTVAEDKLLIADFGAKLSVRDVRTGTELESRSLREPAAYVCPMDEETGRLWISYQGGGGAIIDLSGGGAAEAPEPPSCLIRRCAGDYGLPAIDPSRCRALAPSLGVEGLEVQRSIADDHDAVALGLRRGVLVLAGYLRRPSGPVVTWQRSLAPEWEGEEDSLDARFRHVRVAAGRVFVTIADGTDGSDRCRLIAIDTETGATRWETPTGTCAAYVSPSRAYTLHEGHVEVRDAASGQLIGRVGRVTAPLN